MSFRSIVRDVRDGIGSLSRRSFEVKLSSITGHLKGKSQGLPETHEQSPVIQCSRWASLPPELLRDVIKRLEASESTWPSRKHVVACAAVCRSWREMCLEIVRSPEFCGKLTFPISLKQPGHRDGMIQCFIKRDKSRSTFHLYLCLSPEPCTTIVEKSEFETLEALNHECKIEKKILKFIDAIHKGDEEHDKIFVPIVKLTNGQSSTAVLVENGKFLLSAKRVRKAACTEYLISMDAGHMSRSTNTCIGRLRSNFLGTKFVVYDTQPPCNGATISPPGRTSRRFYSKKVSPKVPSGSYSIAQVSYELNVLGTRGPRRMHCIMHSIPASALEPGGTVPGQPDSLVTRALEDSFRSMSFSKPSIMDRSMDFSSTRFSDIIGGSQEGELNGEIKERPLVLRNKPPRWHEQLQCWCLNFRGRVTVASVKNFQLIAATQPSAGAPTPSQPAPAEYDKIILQFGKVSKDMFTMDYRYPLSAFQAFAICLSSFDTKLACE